MTRAKTSAKAKARPVAKPSAKVKPVAKTNATPTKTRTMAKTNATPTKTRTMAKTATRKPLKATLVRGKKVVLLSGGNPQIAKADGDAPVKAYIAALTGWKHDLAKRIDALIVETLPGVKKAVKWNSPFYGIEGQGWFLGFHMFTRYIKLSFFRGASLDPVPPGPSKDKNTRYLDVYEDHVLDEKQLARWVKQAAALPGWMA